MYKKTPGGLLLLLTELRLLLNPYSSFVFKLLYLLFVISLCAEAGRLLLLAEPVHLYNKRHGRKVTLLEQK